MWQYTKSVKSIGRCEGMWITEQAFDVGFASTPNDPPVCRDVYPFGADGAEVRDICAHQRIAIPDPKDIGLLENLTFPVVGNIVVVVGARGANLKWPSPITVQSVTRFRESARFHWRHPI
jgi:hypothetical protein